MASEDRAPTQHLSFLSSAHENIQNWGLFSLVRGAEARAPIMPRVGRSRLPDQNIVDLAQAPSMGFAASTLQEIRLSGGRAKVFGKWLGLLGPMGPMPTHLSEFAAYEARYSKSQPFGAFLNLLEGRMLQLFYRAWADSQPCAYADRSDDDGFATMISALSGAYEGADHCHDFPKKARLFYAGLMASQRSARGIEDGLSHLLRQNVRIIEFQSRWRSIETSDQSRLGRSYATLGSDLTLGRRVRLSNDAFNVQIATSSLLEYEAFLPGGSRYPILCEAIMAFTPSHLDCEIRLEISEDLVPPTRLDGRARLGLTSWLKPKKTNTIRSDARIRPRFQFLNQ